MRNRIVKKFSSRLLSILIIWMLLVFGFFGLFIITETDQVAAAGPTYVSGIISTNTTWTLTNSPYIIKANLLVNENITLTIQPGVNVKFDTDTYLMVDGTLNAKGTTSQMIVFTSNKSIPSPGDWKYIRFTDKSEDTKCIIEYCELNYAQSGIQCYDASPKIINNIISDNSNYGIVCSGSSPLINNNTIKNMNDGTAISVTHTLDSIINITNNELVNISGNGIRIEYIDTSNVSIINNKISNLIHNKGSINGGIRIYKSISNFLISNNNISYVKNTGGGSLYPGCGIYVEGDIGSIIIDNNTFHNNDYGIKLSPSSGSENIFVKDNIIFNNSVGLHDGSVGYSLISKNLIFENTDIGLKLTETSIANNNTITRNDRGITVHGLNSKINFNNIVNNSGYYLEREFKFDINAVNNYWGTTNTTIIDNRIYDYYDDFNLGKVYYIPFLKKPNPKAPKYKENISPTANAGPDQNVTLGQTITLDGSGSFDIENDILTFEWTSSIDGKLGNSSILKNIKLTAGIHTITLKVDDGERTGTDTCIVRVFDKSGNLPPVAKITPLIQVYIGKSILLSAVGSFDEDGYITTYIWNFGDDSEELSTNKSEVEYTWNSAGNYTVTLIVKDNSSAICTDSLIIIVLESDGNDSIEEDKRSQDNTFIIILIVVVIIVLLILAISKLFITRSKCQHEREQEHEFGAEQENNEEILDNMKQKYLQDESLPEMDYSRNEISEMLESKFKNNQLSEDTYHFIKSEVLFSDEPQSDKIINSNQEGKE